LKVKAELPEPLQFLFQPSRYKVAYGGRGCSKSWGFTDALLIRAVQQKTLILCCREIQKSIKDSVHKLLLDQIARIKLSEYFTISNDAITCSNGSKFIFEGLFRNVNRIKSIEGVNIAWVEEAESVSRESWEMLTPTIRTENSEIWVTFNPDYEDDDTFKRFVVDPADNAIVRKINYMDNPYFPEVLRVEMEQDKSRDKILYEHKWLGIPHGSGGKVFPAFNKKLHVRDFDLKDIAKGNCFMAMDPHSHYYPFCTWMAVLPKNKRGKWPEDFFKHIYAEWPTFDDLGGYYHELRKKVFYTKTLKDMAIEIYGKDGTEHGIQVLNRFIDSRYAKGSGSWNWSTSTVGIVELFSKPENGGLKFELPQEKIIDAQKQVLHSDMLYNTLAPVNQFNEPAFSVSPRCKNTIMCLANHRMEVNTDHESTEKESEKYKDACDTVRINYAGIHNFKYKDPGKPKGRRPRRVVQDGWMS